MGMVIRNVMKNNAFINTPNIAVIAMGTAQRMIRIKNIQIANRNLNNLVIVFSFIIYTLLLVK